MLAGTTNEGLRDGPPDQAFFAQPSGLAPGPDGTLWVADAETWRCAPSSRRPAVGAAVSTAVGQGLFDFGFRDGPAEGTEPALLQHPLGVTVLPDGSVAIADTYNGAVRRYDPATQPSARWPATCASRATCSSTATRSSWWSRRRTGSARVPIPASTRV